MKKAYRLGTRGSPLALVQAQLVRDFLYEKNPWLREEADIEIVPIRTTGDWRPEQHETTFLDMGASKGLFTREIEEALYAGTIDFAVHSMKDISVYTPEGLTFPAFLKREDPRDALFSALAPTLDDLPPGARVGTASLRRKAQVLAHRPDLVVVPLRGNVETRMRKLAAGDADATILAVAGVKRLGVQERIASIFDTKVMLPAVAQGVLGIETRSEDIAIREWLASVNDPDTEICIQAERAALRVLDGSCRTPIAALATLLPDGGLLLDALVARPDGTEVIRLEQKGTVDAPEALGEAVGWAIKEKMPDDFLICPAR